MSSLLADELLASGFLEAGTISLPEIVYGADGTGIYSCNWDSSGHLTITLTDGRVFVSPSLTGPRGLTGARGEPGEKGDPGPEGPVGPRGLTGPIGPQGPQGETGSQGVQGPAGPRGERGPQGITGADGVSPAVQITAIEGGHRVIITDATHPSGQSFDVLDGEGGGSGAVDSVNGQTGAVVLTASDVGAGTYSKPSGGIPETDLASTVQTSLGKADTAYQKPSSGIPASDLAAGVIPSLSGCATKQWVINQGYLTPLDATAILMLSEDGQGGYTGVDAETGRTVDRLNVFDSLYMQEGKRVLLQIPVGGSTTIKRYHPLGTFNPVDGAYFPVLSGNKMTGMYVLGSTGWSYSDAPTIPSLADYQTKSITDAGGYYTTDTVDGALQEIGAELAGINTLIGSGVIT